MKVRPSRTWTLAAWMLALLSAPLAASEAASGADSKRDRRPPALASAMPEPWRFGFVRRLYVSGFGSDFHAGTRIDAPLKTIRAALAKARKYGSGTEILVRDGIYREAGDLLVDFDGTPTRWNALRGYPGERPTIAGIESWNLMHVRGSYFLLEGLELNGSKIGFSTADGTPIRSRDDLIAWGRRQDQCLWSGENCGSGIYVEAPDDSVVHHVIVRDNVVHDFPGAGIATNAGDFLLIEHNRVHHNSFTSFYGHSGISIWHSRSSTSGPTEEVRVMVRGNLSFANHQYVSSLAIGQDRPTDGNGIIFDQNSAFAYPHRMQASNNIVFDNGGSGIHAYDSENIDIFNNTSYRNSAGATQDDGEIFSNTGKNIRIFNNILYAREGKRVNSDWSNRNLTMGRNILYGTQEPDVAGPNDLRDDPRFSAASGDGACPDSMPSAADFMPADSSPAVDGASSFLATTTDYFGRPAQGARDIGAVERP